MNKENEIIARYMHLDLVEGIYYDEELGRVKVKAWMKKPSANEGKMPCLYSGGANNYRFKINLKYNKNWGEIMPVVRSVKKFRLPDKTNKVSEANNTKLKNEVRKALLQLKILPLHKALVDYINFINKLNK